ncbi:hypothetical protein [Micromonospora inositola]|uniref:Uncharacterized protein n=1 Tax=Micromonospora inositola TaxID=47865 RepID=A0A1C5J4J5_9ACTN|nr:hypothetical protein [Micromonospora inositola]SCG65201.1 hypothetical protein GA0070613_3956 [Micromonospora inositola]
MWVEYEDGARLSRSAKKPGSFSPLTRDGGTNNLGHVTLDPIDGDEMPHLGPRERSELEDFLRELAVEVTLIALERARPHVERWVAETAVPAATSAVASAVPAVGAAVASAGSAVGAAVASAGSAVGSAAVTAGSAVGSAVASAGSAVGSAAVTAGSAVGSTVSSAWNKATRKKKKRVVAVESHIGAEPAPVNPAPVEAGVVLEAAPVEASHDVAAAIEAYRAGMSRAEARKRIVVALAARLFSEQQIEIVRNARIDDDRDTAELNSATLALTQKQIGESVQLMLESTPALLAEDAMADLRKILGPAPAEEDGQPERRM